MTSKEIRQAFLDFFRKNHHHIVPSAPMVIQNDPTLMFTNAGMNQFKDIFLGNQPVSYRRIANTQKCLRVSGKHNDLEEVGLDTYHHTMFEMLGNWSFGDYFKKEAIALAWEFLTGTLGIQGDRLYATVFEGDRDNRIEWDEEAYHSWLEHLDKSSILKGSKKDNFWEMGDTGPCGPCSEIHVDIRPDNERKKLPGRDLVNKGNPGVMELWNLVFIQYNRKTDGHLQILPSKHIDTGLGFERLCMVLQRKQSNYDTDLFQPLILEIEKITGKKYGKNKHTDIAIRVIADHLRAITFAITDGQLPSNTRAGYVIRRILRRAVRYGYTYLGQRDAFIYKLVIILCNIMEDAFPEIKSQEAFVRKVIREEEKAFLRTLDTGIKMLDQLAEQAIRNKQHVIDGKSAFELYDTYGFPLDLTQLILREKNLTVDQKTFDSEMKKQKTRSKVDATMSIDDWTELGHSDGTEFIGYDTTTSDVRILRYRKVKKKGRDYYQMIFDKTPFYAESGGQIGDQGYIETKGEKISILDTQKEHNLVIHLTDKLPSDPSAQFKAFVTDRRRIDTARNHTSTHLLHYALRNVLGPHAEQKGSLVHPDYLRFDFSHFQKVTEEELHKIESMVNELIRANLPLEEKRSMKMSEAMDMGALAFFGDKYGENVRVIKFGDSVELCGGTHVHRTGDIGYFIITGESAVAAGIRRIEAKSGKGAEEYVQTKFRELKDIGQLIKSPHLHTAISKMMKENADLKNQFEESMNELRAISRNNLLGKIHKISTVNVIAEETQLKSEDNIKNLVYELRNQVENLFLVVGANLYGKAHLSVMISDNLVKKHGLDAREIINEIAPDIHGGGGGQAFYATAGGKNPEGLLKAIKKAKDILKLRINLKKDEF
jgi:alanyl-tRNA synthetase